MIRIMMTRHSSILNVAKYAFQLVKPILAINNADYSTFARNKSQTNGWLLTVKKVVGMSHSDHGETVLPATAKGNSTFMMFSSCRKE